MKSDRKSPLTESEISVRDFIKRHAGSINILRGGWPDFIVRSRPHVAVEVKLRTDDLSHAQRRIASSCWKPESAITWYTCSAMEVSRLLSSEDTGA